MTLKSIKVIALAAAAAVTFSGCATKMSTIAQVHPSLSNTNTKYKILTKTEGTAECMQIFFIEVGETACGGGILSMLFKPNEPLPVEIEAMTRAVDSIPDADAMLAPRFTVESKQFFLFFQKKRVTVKGKAIEFL